MSEPLGYSRKSKIDHPPSLYEDYKSTVLRHPKRKPVRLDHTLSEVTGPLFKSEKMDPGEDDLSIVDGKEAQGQRIFVSGRVLDENEKPIPNTLIEILDQISSKSNLSIYGISSGMAHGPDLGSNKFRTLKKPSVGLIVGDGIDSYDAGEIWHLMDIRYNIPITKLDNSKILNHDLERYNCIILPNSFSLNETVAEKLKIQLII